MRQLGRLVVVVTMLVGALAIVPAVSASSETDVVSWGNVHYSERPTYGPTGGVAITADAMSGGLLILMGDGTVASWGAADPPAGLTGVIKVAANCGVYVALKSDGTVVSWNGPGATANPVPAGLKGVTDISLDCGFAVALKNDGTVVAWGNDASGQTDVPTGLSGVTAIATAGYTLAVKSDGTVVAWGDSAPKVPAGLSNVVAVSPSSGFALALKSDGTVAAWGSDAPGTAVPAGLTGVASVTAVEGGIYPPAGLGFAVKTDGTVVAWGGDYYNYGYACDASKPPSGISNVVSLVSDGVLGAVIKSDGTVQSWGNACTAFEYGFNGLYVALPYLSGVTDVALGGGYAYALMADGTLLREGGYALSTEQPSGLNGVSSVDAGSRHDIALMGDGRVLAWGDGSWGQTSLPSDMTGITQVSAGGSRSYGLKSDGTVVYLHCDGCGDDIHEPPAGLSGVTSIDAGGTLWASYVLARKTSGTVAAWGDDTYGQTDVPAGLTGVTAVSAGGSCALALKSNQTVVGWGDYCTAAPAGLTGVTAIAAGGDFQLALKSDHTVVAWGDDSYGQADVPAGLSGVAAIAAGADFALALKSDGTVVAWGNDDQGQTDLPAGLTGVTQITAGQDFASAIYSGAPAATSVSVSGLSTPRFGGGTGTVTVEVRDGSGRLAYGYRGTIQFTSNDPSATLPSDYTFTGADRGSHVFVVTLATAGTRWLTATDTVTGSLMGSQTGIVVHSPSAPGAPTAVRAMAANGAVFVAWTPPISTGGRPVTSYRVTSSPGGKTCTTVGTSCRISGLTNEQPYTFTVKATNSAGTGPAATSTTATPTTTTHLGVAVSTNPTVAGAGHSVTVTALDAGGNVATAYRGTVHFTSSDAGAGLPADYTFSATDAGVHKFTNGLALKTAGSQSVTVTDASSRVLGSVSGIVVTPGAMKSFGVALAANPTVAGAVHSVTVKALDAYGNVVPTYTGRIHFTSSDSAAVLPADYTFTAADKGAHKFTNGVTLETSGARLITVTDTVTAAMTGSESVTVTAAAAKTLKVSVAANPYVAGSAHSLTITALDTYGNVATGYRGKIHLTSSDSAAILPADYTFTATDAGVHKFTNGLTLKTAGARSVTATDKSSASITGSATVTVTPGAATTFSLSIAANPFGAGSAHSVTVKAFDACGNVATGYVGTIHFTSSDGAAVLPADYTFTGGDAGTHKFTNGVTLKTAGSQSVTATDTSHSSITGSQTVTVN